MYFHQEILNESEGKCWDPHHDFKSKMIGLAIDEKQRELWAEISEGHRDMIRRHEENSASGSRYPVPGVPGAAWCCPESDECFYCRCLPIDSFERSQPSVRSLTGRALFAELESCVWRACQAPGVLVRAR